MTNSARITPQIAEQRYQHLFQFLLCYLHQDWPVFHPSPEAAVDDAISESSAERRQCARAQLEEIMANADDDVDLRRILNDCFGVNLFFPKAREARDFADMVLSKLNRSLDQGG